MFLRLLAAPALIAASLAPAASLAQSAQITIQTQATVIVPPDRATVPVNIRVTAQTEREARTLLEAREKETRKTLADVGFKPEQISLVAATGPEITIDTDYEACAAAKRAAEVAEAAADDSDSEGEAAAAAASAAAAFYPEDCGKKFYVGKRQLSVQIDGAAKLEAMAAAERGDDLQLGRASFTQTDPEAARSKARDAALVQARQEADATAAAMGYRITGISRVSTAPAPISLDGIVRFITEVDGPARKRGPEWYTGSVSQTVTIDFIAVPK